MIKQVVPSSASNQRSLISSSFLDCLEEAKASKETRPPWHVVHGFEQLQHPSVSARNLERSDLYDERMRHASAIEQWCEVKATVALGQSEQRGRTVRRKRRKRKWRVRLFAWSGVRHCVALLKVHHCRQANMHTHRRTHADRTVSAPLVGWSGSPRCSFCVHAVARCSSPPLSSFLPLFLL